MSWSEIGLVVLVWLWPAKNAILIVYSPNLGPEAGITPLRRAVIAVQYAAAAALCLHDLARLHPWAWLPLVVSFGAGARCGQFLGSRSGVLRSGWGDRSYSFGLVFTPALRRLPPGLCSELRLRCASR